MSELLKSYKGARDFYPEDKRLQKWMFQVMRETVERYGYEEYDAPVLENTELYRLKGSEEIINEQSYTFTDRGERSVTMRTEMTPSVSRMVAARRQELAYPLRWYSIPNLWRYERPQRGRLREFWQLNVDLFGVKGIEADFEMIQIADAVMQAFHAKRTMYVIKLNSRLFVDKVLRGYLGLDATQSDTMRRLIDKKDKMEPAAFEAAIDAIMSPSQRDEGGPSKLLSVLHAEHISDYPDELRDDETLSEVKRLVEMLERAGIVNIVFDPSLMRGFDYYTDIVFEVFDTSPDNNRSMFGGGRYDGLVGLFGVEPIPTVGFGMGDATLENFLADHDLLPKLDSETDLYIALMEGIFEESEHVIREMREEGVRVAVDMTGRKIGKQIETADKKGIRFALVIGPDEIESAQFRLKDLRNHTEETHSLERVISLILAERHKSKLHEENVI